MRPTRASFAALIAAALVLFALAGCGGGSEDIEDPASAAPSAEETVHRLPDLARGWSREVNHDAGFAFGLPPGWTVREDRGASLARSPDHLAAVSIAADRTDEALEPRLDDYASAALAALPGFDELDPGQPRAYRHRYPAIAVEADARARERGVRQKLLLVALRRGKLAVFIALAAVNAERRPEEHMEEAERIIRTIRGRPVVLPATSSD